MDVREKIAIFNRRKERGAAPFGTGDDGVPPMPAFGEGKKLLVTGSSHDDYGLRNVADPLVQARLTARLHNKIVNNGEAIIQYEDYYTGDADVIAIACGFTARSSLFAVVNDTPGWKEGRNDQIEDYLALR